MSLFPRVFQETSSVGSPSLPPPPFYRPTQSYVDCSATNLPDFTITLSGNSFVLKQKDYISKTVFNACYTIFTSQKIEGADASLWSLGAPFLRVYYSIYDRGQDRVGFAKSK